MAVRQAQAGERTRLSENFTLDEFTRSQTAARLGREIVAAPGSPEFVNLARLCNHVLQPVREKLGPVQVTSGLRPDWLNRIIGGSKTSQHVTGQAADFVVTGCTPREVCACIAVSEIPFDQLILEFGKWVHVSVAAPGGLPRRQVLTARKHPESGATVYVPGLPMPGAPAPTEPNEERIMEEKQQPTARKAGYKTSEFWLVVAGAVVTIANDAFGLALPAEAILSVVGLISSYVLGRSFLKRAA